MPFKQVVAWGLACTALQGVLALAGDVYVSRQFTLAPTNGETAATSRAFTLVPHDFDIPISRQFTLAPDEGADIAASRLFTIVPDDAEVPVSAQLTLTASPFAIVSSSDSAAAFPISADGLPSELNTLNTAPPAYDSDTWFRVNRRNDNFAELFRCDDVSDPLDEGFVDASYHLADFDEITFDNCGPAFYRVTFNLPRNTTTAALSASANVDAQGVAWLNGVAVSALVTVPNCEPTGGPNDPCYDKQDAGEDRTDSNGRRVLTWPTLDPIETNSADLFQDGENELVFGVSANAMYYHPTGVEFAALVMYQFRGDVNCDGSIDFNDIDPFVAALIDLNKYSAAYPGCLTANADVNDDGTVDFNDIDPFVVCLINGECE